MGKSESQHRTNVSDPRRGDPHLKQFGRSVRAGQCGRHGPRPGCAEVDRSGTHGRLFLRTVGLRTVLSGRSAVMPCRSQRMESAQRDPGATWIRRIRCAWPSCPANLRAKWQADPIERNTHTEEEIKDMLFLMGKTTREKELDCGACGYESCRAKAIAVLEGKADPKLCLPTHSSTPSRFPI